MRVLCALSIALVLVADSVIDKGSKPMSRVPTAAHRP
jgi:hypothetical protein